jgi:excisionase family DNA binding protein
VEVGILAQGKASLTMKQAARMLNADEERVALWCDQGILQAYRVTHRGQRRISADSLRAMLKQK